MSLAADLRAALDPAVLFEQAFGVAPLEWQVGYLRETRPAVAGEYQCVFSKVGATLFTASKIAGLILEEAS